MPGDLNIGALLPVPDKCVHFQGSSHLGQVSVMVIICQYRKLLKATIVFVLTHMIPIGTEPF